MNPFALQGGIAFSAARWPIQTIAFISAAVFVAYVLFVDVAPQTPYGPLSRTFAMWDENSYEPSTRFLPQGVDTRFVGAPIVVDPSSPYFASTHSENSADAELSLHAEDEAYTRILDTLEIPLPQVLSPGESPVLLLPAEKYYRAINELKSFEVSKGNTWHLDMSYSWLVWLKWYWARLVDVVHEAPWFDRIVVGAGWIGMYYTFYRLFQSMRKLGSRTYLFAAALVSSTFAFLGAYAIADLAGLVVPKRALVQGLPFFVLVVGFDSKVVLARESVKYLFESGTEVTGDPEEVDYSAAAVRKALEANSTQILRDSTIEIVFLLLAAYATKIPGLWEFSVLSALVLLMDFGFLITFYAATLSLKLTMIKIERNHEIHRALLEDGVSLSAAERYAKSADAQLLHSAASIVAGNPHRGFGSLRLVVLLMIMAYNYLQITDFPISPFVHSYDWKSSPTVGNYVEYLTYPCVLTVLPPLRFTPSANNTFFRPHSGIRGLFATISAATHTDIATRTTFLALLFSLILNGYLVSLSRKNSSHVEVVEHKVPVVVERRMVEGSEVTTTEQEADGSIKTETIVKIRSVDDCRAIIKAGLAAELSNEELVSLGVGGHIPLYALEKTLKDTTRAVAVRRSIISRLSSSKTLESSLLPWKEYDYDRVLGACCENVVGYLPLPLGIAGPVVIDGRETYIPMATTEGVLVASTMRGCKALNGGGGVTTQILGDGMTRGPCVTFASAARASDAKRWLDGNEGWTTMQKAFDSTSRFARLKSIKTAQAGVFLYIRFRAQTGDAMGMNMISKGVERALQVMATECDFDDMSIVSVSGNFCTDKKATALNWIDGRGKSVVAEAVVPGHLVESILKTTVDALVELNMAKNLVGSAMAGTIGGYNAQAANLVAAIFLATGQDPAQVVEGSNCITLMSNVDGDLQISVSMPSIEVGTIGGGTILEPQAAMLDMLGVKGPHPTSPGENARNLARVVATGVLAGELSLNAALAAGHLVRSHMAHNRAKPAAEAAAVTAPK